MTVSCEMTVFLTVEKWTLIHTNNVGIDTWCQAIKLKMRTIGAGNVVLEHLLADFLLLVFVPGDV